MSVWDAFQAHWPFWIIAALFVAFLGAILACADSEAEEAKLATATEALRIIAGEQQCLDNLMSDKEVARAALDGLGVTKP